MKRYLFLVTILVLSIVVAGCRPVPTQAPRPETTSDVFAGPTPAGLTPASLDPIIGRAPLAVAVSDNWPSYWDGELGIAVSYPSEWQAVALRQGSGVGLYPPTSDPELPTPMIRIEWLAVPYSPDQPLVRTEGDIDPIEVAGVTGRAYQDSQFAIPTQSHYIELPYHDGILFFSTTLGPSVDLTPQLREVLKTFAFLDDAPAATEAPENAGGNEVFEVTVSATQSWQDTHVYIRAGMGVFVEVIAGQWTHWMGTKPYNPGDGDIYYVCADAMAASQCLEPVPGFAQGGLVGKINDQVFGIGSVGEIYLQENGNLYLRINDGDDGLFDNDGELTVRITLSN
jgi:hypothetical protein